MVYNCESFEHFAVGYDMITVTDVLFRTMMYDVCRSCSMCLLDFVLAGPPDIYHPLSPPLFFQKQRSSQQNHQNQTYRIVSYVTLFSERFFDFGESNLSLDHAQVIDDWMIELLNIV